MNRNERRAPVRESRNDSSDHGAATTSLYELGLRHYQAHRAIKAQACCQRALELDPNHANSLHLLGLLCLGKKQYDHALEWLIRAIRQDPRPDYLSTLGTTLQRQGRHEEALKAFDKAVQLKPDDAKLWQDLGNVLADLKRTTDAALAFQHALKLDPKSWEAADRCGMLLHGLGRLEEALSYFSKCQELKPDQGQTLYRRGHTLLELQRYDQALIDLERAHALDPNHAGILNSLGLVLQTLERHTEALKAFDEAVKLQANYAEAINNKAVSLAYFHHFQEALALVERAFVLQPNYVAALVNKGIWLSELHRFDEAVAAFDQARALDPSNADVEWNLSFLHLLMGDFESGWIEREARWNAMARFSTSYPDFAQPRWIGKEPVEGKTVLIYAEEGLGDAIQFARYIPMVAALGAKIILVVAEAVRVLLSKLAGVSECLRKPMQEQPPFDYHCALSSLPLIFKTRLDTIPAADYLTPLPTNHVQEWEDRLGPHEKLRVGLGPVLN